MVSATESSNETTPDPGDSTNTQPHPVISSHSSVSQDPSDQFYLHHSDSPSLKLSTTLLSDFNYNRWRRSVEVSLLAKNKLGFVTGTCQRPEKDPKLAARWDQCNNMLISWLLHSLEKDIAESVLYCKSAAQIWTELGNRYGKVNRTHLFQLQRDINSISQGNHSITFYFTQLKKLWDEYSLAIENQTCICGSNNIAMSILKDQQIIQFLVGLNDSFHLVRSNILMLSPAPNLDQVYQMVLQDEAQRGLGGSSTNIDDATALYAQQKGKSSSYSRSNTQNRSTLPRSLFCDHCKATNHNIDKCWKLHGYPTSAAPGISFCDHCKIAGHVIARCWKIHGYPTGHKLAATALSQEQMNQLLSLLPKHSNSDNNSDNHTALLAGPFDEASLGDW